MGETTSGGYGTGLEDGHPAAPLGYLILDRQMAIDLFLLQETIVVLEKL